MTSPDANVKHALKILNDALERDSRAITQLVNARVSCEDRLSKHATVQTRVFNGSHMVGALGLINGILGYKHGGIGAEGEVDGRTGKFVRIHRFVHLKAGLDLDA